MALQNDPRMYSGGSAAFDSSPTVNTYRQIEGERRAKDEALDKYVRELNMKITPTGMRRQEDEVFRDKYAQWMNLGKDRQKLNNPQYRMEFEMRGQELRNLIERSKAEEEAKKLLVPILLDPKKRQELRPEAIGEIDLHDQPLFIKSETGEWIENPNRKRIDISGNLFKSPEFDFQEEFKGAVGLMKPGEVIEFDKPYTDEQTANVFFPAKEKFNKDQAAQIGKNFLRSVSGDQNKLDYYAMRMAQTSLDEYKKLDDIHRKYYGTPIGKDGNSPARFAAAEAVLAAEQSARDLKPVSKSDYERKLQDKRINISLNQSNNAKPTPTIDLTGYKDVPGGGKDITDLMRGVKVTGFPDGSSFLAKSVVFNPSTKQVTYTEYTDKGNASPKTVTLTKFMQDIKTLNPQLDMKFLEGLWNATGVQPTATQPTPTTTPSVPSYKKADLIKKGWTQDQINTAVKAGKIKVI